MELRLELMAWYKSKTFILFIVLLVHVTLLDFFFVTHQGPVFLFDKNSELKTIVTHLLIVLASVGFYVLLTKYREHYRKTTFRVSEITWVIWSVILIFSIGFVLI